MQLIEKQYDGWIKRDKTQTKAWQIPIEMVTKTKHKMLIMRQKPNKEGGGGQIPKRNATNSQRKHESGQIPKRVGEDLRKARAKDGRVNTFLSQGRSD